MVGKSKRTGVEVARAKALYARRSQLKLTSFEVTQKAIFRRIAEFLLWAREKYPYQVITFEEITQVVHGTPRLPQAGTPLVKSTKNAIPTANKLLLEEHGVSLIPLLGVGTRCEVNALDMAKHTLPASAARLSTARSRFRSLVRLLPSRAELREQALALGVGEEQFAEDLEVIEWAKNVCEKYVKAETKLALPTETLALPPAPCLKTVKKLP
ncbi:hypothetical protein KJ782_06960 [Patescibacteria group bacterium]|nr:hypothetical protein [Patescibacteria group bacterium]